MDEKYKAEFRTLDALKENADADLKRKRGLNFEKLINDICQSEKILLRAGFHTDDNKAEQIDGAIEVSNRIFLLEVKWVGSNLAASELYSFIGKVENKFQGTAGIFISRNQLTENFINALNKGRRQSVIVIHGQDIMDIFSNDVSIKEYLEQTIRVMSYNNVAHYPVQDFLESKKPLLTRKEETDHNVLAVNYIQENILKGQLTEEDVTCIDKTQTDMLDIVFSYLINKFGSLYIDAVNKNEFSRIRNIETFLTTYRPSPAIHLSAAESYYSRLVTKGIRLYGRQEFRDLFKGDFDKISQAARDSFEIEIVRIFEQNRGDYNMENTLTMLLEPIWSLLKPATQNQLSRFYLDYYVDGTRQVKFPQKIFATELLHTGQIPKQLISEWLDDKFKNARESYDGITPDISKFIASAYMPIAKYLDIQSADWLQFVENKML